MEDRSVARAVVETLRDLGVRHVFGVPSGGFVDYMDALRSTDGIEFILTSHEGGAGFMADVCGRLTGVPGVCFGTFGPGATNLATGVGSALLDRSPMLALTDEMPAALRGRTVQMGIDHQALFAPLTKATTRISPADAAKVIADAAALALSGRPGPIHVGLPSGISGEPSPEQAAPIQKPDLPSSPAQVDIDRLLARLSASRRPVIVAGLGANRLGDRLVRLAEHLQVPVLLTPMAKGLLPETHRCYAGVLFHALSREVAATHADADLILAIGYDPVEFNYESWMADGLSLAHLDIIAADIDRSIYTDVLDVVGDPAVSVDSLLAAPAPPNAWDLDALGKRMAAIFAAMQPKMGVLGPCEVLEILREILPADGIMACDVGAHTHLIGQKWPTPAPGTQLMTNGWSAMGFGLPAAIAAKLCRPDQAVCAVVGDGGFLMTVGELATAVRERLPIVIVVLTDNDLALIRIKQQRKNNPVYGTPVRREGTIGGPSLFGVPVETARTGAELRVALRRAFAADGPVIVEALVDSREYDSLVLQRDKP